MASCWMTTVSDPEKVKTAFALTSGHVNAMEFTGLNALSAERSLQ